MSIRSTHNAVLCKIVDVKLYEITYYTTTCYYGELPANLSALR